MALGRRPVRPKKKDFSQEPNEWLTYAQWFLEGRHVRRGEKSVRRDKSGVPLFARSQTEMTRRTRSTGAYAYSDSTLGDALLSVFDADDFFYDRY